jgi:hypothetical protein
VQPSFITKRGRPEYRIEEDGSIAPLHSAVGLTPEIEAYNEERRALAATSLHAQAQTTVNPVQSV